MSFVKEIRCPSYAEDCPYYKAGWCQMKAETGDHPSTECDDYAYYVEEEEDDNE